MCLNRPILLCLFLAIMGYTSWSPHVFTNRNNLCRPFFKDLVWNCGKKTVQYDGQNYVEEEISSLLAISSTSSLPPTISAPAALASSASAPSAKTATLTAWKMCVIRWQTHYYMNNLTLICYLRSTMRQSHSTTNCLRQSWNCYLMINAIAYNNSIRHESTKKFANDIIMKLLLISLDAIMRETTHFNKFKKYNSKRFCPKKNLVLFISFSVHPATL